MPAAEHGGFRFFAHIFLLIGVVDNDPATVTDREK
jgi:hypothetical protein